MRDKLKKPQKPDESPHLFKSVTMGFGKKIGITNTSPSTKIRKHTEDSDESQESWNPEYEEIDIENEEFHDEELDEDKKEEALKAAEVKKVFEMATQTKK